MLRDVFYYGNKPNAHPRERLAKSLEDARRQATTEHFWIINEYCDYRGFDWAFDFELLPDEDVWAENHNNVWPSQHQKDSGTWLCPKEHSDIVIYRSDVDVVKRKKVISDKWKLLEKIDTNKFDFSWHPDPTDPPYIYAWGCKFFPVEFYVCLEYHAPGATEYKYMDTIVELLPNYDCLKEYQKIDNDKFDISWRPDPMDPPYIYTWGNKYISGELQPTLEYHTSGATERKYMPEILHVLPEHDRWEIPDNVDTTAFDLSWRPDPREPAYIYQFGTQWQKTNGPRYITPGATEIKYMDNQCAIALPDKKNYVIVQHIDESKFDFSWHPDANEPPYIYVWGNKYIPGELLSTIEYHCNGAIEKKYMAELVEVVPEYNKWKIHQEIDKNKFDMSWRPDPREPAYIYTWGNKYVPAEIQPTLEYHTPGATERKYMGVIEVLPELDKWNIVQSIDKTCFDLSWRPDPREPAYIYVWGNKWIPGELKSTIEYHCENATERKYMGVVEVLPELSNWCEYQIINKNKFDLTWRPDPREPAYIYVWGNKYVSGEIKPTIEYIVDGANERKYMGDVEVLPELDRWKIHQEIDKTKFDLSWRPDPREPAYIYVWGNKWIPGEIKPTLEYYCEGATERKYMGNVDVLPEIDKWNIVQPIDKNKFDLTWRPDPREPAYIYVWGNKYIPGELKSTIEYHVPGATNRKYMSELIDVLPDERWKIHQEIDKTKFDLSWRPDPREPAYIYVWGNKYIPGEIKPTLEYYCEGATERKYMGNVDVLPEFEKYKVTQKVKNFDFTWRPDPREPAYIYTWGNKYIPAEIQPTLEYYTSGATERKYMGNLDVEPELEKYKIYSDIEDFDFSWRPDPREPAYIYTWGNKWVQGEIEPTLEYHCEGATERKYMGIVDVKPQYNKWIIYQNNTFDLTWRPDPREPAYIYVWGNKYIPGEIKPTLEYYCAGATERKYMGEVPVTIEHEKWKIYQNITNFDLTWRPDPREPAYIYTWGNKYIPAEIQPTLEYHTLGATERKYMGDVEVLPEDEKWVIHFPINSKQFDMAWRPDPREPAYIYTWGNKYIPGELRPTLEYIVEGATERKYMGEVPVLPLWQNYKIHAAIKDFDYTWMPDPREPPYIYTWGNKYVPAEIEPTLEFYVEGATERKYMGNINVLPEKERWVEHQLIDKTKFDLSWRPDPREPAYIYVWGNKWIPGEIKPTLEYHTPGATEFKYMGNVDVVSEKERWVEHQLIDKNKFDMSWRPDPREPAYIYVWGNKYIPGELKSTLEYYCEGATEKKYMGNIDVLPELSKWVEHQQIDKTKFDLSWRPDPREPAYIYVWGNKWIPGILKPTLEYHCEGAIEYKYMQEPIEVLPEYDHWVEVQKVKNFDFTWRPDPREPAYIYTWGNKWIKGELKSTLEYHCPEATERKYMGDVEVEPEYDRYVIHLPIDRESFDFSWRPDPREPAYIYIWGNQSNSAEVEPTVEYHCAGATEKKYMNDRHVKTLPNTENWKVLIPVDDFDYSWRPDPGSPPYIYVFGNQWHDAMTEPTLEYHVTGALDKKYVTDVIAKVSKTHTHWKTLLPVESFDYSWRPNPHSPPYIYVFGNQWNDAVREPTVEYHQPDAIDYKYVDDIMALVKSTSTESHWKKLIPVESFDYSWRPDPKSPPYIYVFGNKWNDSVTEPTIEYHMAGATDRKYMNEPVAIPMAQINLWSVSNNQDLETFDFTWRPNPHSPPQIYQWENNGPRYTVPGAKEVVLMKRTDDIKKSTVNKYYITTTLEDLINEHPEEVFWVLNSDLNYDKFDFTWRPDESNFRHINVFGNQYGKDTQTYFINAPLYLLGYRDYNYVETQVIETETNLSMFYIDKSNIESEGRYQKLKEKYPDIQKTRYFNNWVETISRCIKKTKSKLFWVLNSELDYSDFKFDFYPSPWQQKMIHVFGTQWSHWGTTYLINSETFNEDSKYVKVIEHLNNLNFIKGKKAKATNCLYDVYLIDHGNYESVDVIYEISEKIGSKKLHTIDFAGNYYTTFKEILNKLQGKNDKFIWVCNSICHYDNFEFNYICDPFAVNQLHVFPSDKQKYGDTFLVNVEMLRKFIDDVPLLEEFVDINYNNHQTVTRISPPEFISEDTHVKCSEQKFQFPYAIFKTKDNKKSKVKDSEPISLWSDNSQNILVTSTGGTRIIVPKRAQRYIKKELYDYPFIKKAQNLIQSEPLDIVFLSNGEINADENYEHLLTLIKNLPNKVIRVDGVNGRVQAYHAVANASNTPWAFTVFAKLRVNEDFDFNWQPDRLQIAKHYVFTATNPVNNLEYGHQAMIAYNKNLVLNNKGIGLDFTLDDPHEIVNINSGIAMFDTDAYSTWRTAFREAIKLHSDTTIESCDRLNAWLNVGIGPYGSYSIKGANDGIKYYEEVNGDFDKLKLSYEWEWLKNRYTHDNP